MIPYIFHVSILLCLSYLFYKLLLGKETFFQLNRWVLVGMAVLAFGLPLLEVPQAWSLRQAEVIEVNKSNTKVELNTFSDSKNSLALNEEETSSPIENEKLVQDAPIQIEEPELREETLVMDDNTTLKEGLSVTLQKLSIWQVLKYLYLAGLAIFALNFLIQLLVLTFKMIQSPSIKDGPYRIVELNQDKAPFSFFNSIFLNPAKYDWDTYNQILEHEKIHLSQAHTLDILLAELMLIVQWFNPFAWFYRKEIENNLEFLTDQKMITKGTDPQAYQLNLLKVSVPNLPLNLTTNYNQSILKKRIIMMNAKKSSVQSSWKYFFILPVLALTVISFNTVQPIIIENEEPVTIEKTTSVQPIEGEIQSPKEIEDINTKQIAQLTQLTQLTPLKNIDEPIENSEEVNIDNFILENGKWEASLKDGRVCIQFSQESNYGNWWGRKECFKKAELGNLPSGNGSFKLERESGTVTFNGSFDGSTGSGTYSFEENASYRSWLQQQGFDQVDESTMFHICLSDINKAWFTYLKNQGYGKVSNDDLKSLAVHGLSQEAIAYYIDGFKKLGYDQLTLQELVKMEIHEVDVDYVKELGDLVYKKLSIDDVIKAKIHDVDPDYIKEFHAAGYKDLSFDDLIRFAIHDVDIEYINELKAGGLGDLSADEITKAAIHDVDAGYIKSFKAAGFSDLDFDDLVRFAIHGVDVKYVEELKSAGLSDLSADEITKAGIHGIDAAYIKDLKTAGFTDMSFDDIVRFGIHGIDGDYIKELKSSGLNDLSSDEITKAGIHGIDAAYIKELKAAGFSDMSFDDIVRFGIHGIDGDYIKELKSSGLSNLSADEITKAGIHGIDAAYIKDLKSAGFTDMNFDDIVRFGIHGIDSDYIKELKAAGLKDLDADKITKAGIHGVDADYIKEFSQAGFDNLGFEDLIQFSIHGIDVEFIQEYQKLGYSNLSKDELVQAGIHDVDAKFIKSLEGEGFKNVPMDQLVQAKIHDVDADYIKEAKAKGENHDSLEAYIKLKIESYGTRSYNKKEE